MTTRNPRPLEQDGVDYFFVTKEEFENKIKEGELLEYAQFVGNYYGTPLSYVERLLDEGKNVMLEIEVQGALQVIEKRPDVLSIFLLPPSLEELEKRIRGRQTESEEVIQKRVSKAMQELKETQHYKHVVCNDDLAITIENIRNILLEEINEYNK